MTFNEQQNQPVWSIATKFLLINITRHKLNVTTTTFDILLKFYRILDHQRSILVTELWKFCRYCKVLCICRCLNAWELLEETSRLVNPISHHITSKSRNPWHGKLRIKNLSGIVEIMINWRTQCRNKENQRSHNIIHAFVIWISSPFSCCMLERSSFSFTPFPVWLNPTALPAIFYNKNKKSKTSQN